jgi:hypothetical protein
LHGRVLKECCMLPLFMCIWTEEAHVDETRPS